MKKIAKALDTIFLFDGPTPDPVHYSYSTATIENGECFTILGPNEVEYKGENYFWMGYDYSEGIEYETIRVLVPHERS